MPRYHPDFEMFSRLARDARLVPVYRQILSDTLTPVSAFGRIDCGSCAFLFESVVGGERIGRYSFLGADPFLELDACDRRVRLAQVGQTREFEADDPLAELERLVAEHRA